MKTIRNRSTLIREVHLEFRLQNSFILNNIELPLASAGGMKIGILFNGFSQKIY